MMSRYAKAKNQPDQDQPRRDPGKCAAYGCPLAGTKTGSLKGSDQWYCRFHDGHDITEFDQISQRIRRHLPLIEHAAKMVRLGPVAGSLVATGNAQHRKQPGENWSEYVRRLNGLVFSAIHGGGRATSSEDAA